MQAVASTYMNGNLSRLERKIPIPDYTLGEELLNAITHGLGGALGIAGLVLMLVKGYSGGSTLSIVSAWVFGVSLVILYTMSCLYHALKPGDAKRVMRIFDHCTIFLLIAGSYTPFTLISLKGRVGWSLFGVIWGMAVLGIVFNAIDMERFTKLSMVCYLTMGWAILFAFKPLLSVIPHNAFLLLLIGGISYTVGAVIFGIGSKVKYMHSLWHLFVMAGSILHFFCIYYYVIR
ncbi:hemolysin III [Lachnospiraceae bacterium RM5]|nr:hemolysin III [Lachnospiraceae bacterium RM5]